MKLRAISFRLRIILTLVVVVSIFSSFGIYIYNRVLLDRIYRDSEKDIENVLYILRDEIINVHDGRLIMPLLKNIEKDKRIIQVYLMDAEGNLVFPPADSVQAEDTAVFRELMSADREIQVVTSRSNHQPSSLAFLQVHNRPECYACHDSGTDKLGYVAMNISLKDTRDTLAYMRTFSILFTIFIVLTIMVFVMIMHYRFIRKSLGRFKHAIHSINEGDLGERVSIKESSELAVLGSAFNKMLDNFQRTNQELAEYHQKELESAEKLATIGEMAARLAHDVRNPLTGIANAIEIIAADMQDSPNKPVIEEIRRQSARVNVAITNLLKFARSAEIKKHKGNINDLLNNLVFFLKNQKQNSRMAFDLEADPKVPEMEYDAEQMENVLMNLCINAIQAMRNEGEIRIRTKLCLGSDSILISIQDNGPGIPKDIEENIFKPFFTTRTEGTGLGLAIAKDIVEKHRGKIWFDSNRKSGTIFYISLPLNPNGQSNHSESIKR